ncbi:hypothetical protein AYX13_05163 [Cryptococcus neoformans]|nr:hypothetical protein AYX13_05163 [Cryptococcus neoformans var. grubii]
MDWQEKRINLQIRPSSQPYDLSNSIIHSIAIQEACFATLEIETSMPSKVETEKNYMANVERKPVLSVYEGGRDGNVTRISSSNPSSFALNPPAILLPLIPPPHLCWLLLLKINWK